MKKQLLFIVVCIFALLYFSVFTKSDKANTRSYPAPKDPTIVLQGQEEDDENIKRKEMYFEKMHRAAPNTNWRKVDAQTKFSNYQNKLQTNALTEIFANGAVVGEWFERGSKNQAGNMEIMDYVKSSNQIYSISGGGTLWKGNLTGTNWTPINEDLQFDKRILKVIDNGNGGKRILTCIEKIIHYSDDDGVTWQAATGFGFNHDWGNPQSLYVKQDANNTIYYLVKTWDAVPWAARYWLFASTNRGTTFNRIHDFGHGLDKEISMWSPFESTNVYVLDRSSTLFEVNSGGVSVVNTNSTLPTGVKIQLRGHKSGNSLTLYALMDSKNLYRSNNYGSSWLYMGALPEDAWNVGIEVSLDNPNIVYFGAVEAFRSFNGGSSWTKVNNWYDYYNDVPNKLHADMMDFASFYDNSGNEFTLIGNHGGINISYDNLVSTPSISLQGLNVSQYYDVRTSPSNPNYFYAGSQDQGHQRSSTGNSTSVDNFTQVISGDYGHMAFSNNGQSFWTQYPGGWFHYYHTPQSSGYDATFDVTGNDMPNYNWMLPTAEVPNASLNRILVGGGERNGGNGSYLLGLTALKTPPYTISASQYSYNFKNGSNSGTGLISAIATSKINSNKFYVSTDDGTFFYSDNAGNTWNKSSTFNGQQGWYLYGASIYASKVSPNVVYYAGSGYSNPAVFKSTDGGQNFSPMSTDLPSTLVHEITANADETLFFAATAVGPYVYVVAEDKWHQLAGLSAPVQRYTSVEFIAASNTVRFGTYGRGIWDFKVQNSAYLEPNICLWLEGAYDATLGKMRTELGQKGLLPSGHPYQQPPWNYPGAEGTGWTNADYPAGSVDWVLVSLRMDPAPGSEVGVTAAVLLEDGCLFFPKEKAFSVTLGSSFYVVVEHRNHLSVMSPTPVNVTGGALTYDFRTSNSYVNGTGYGQKPFPNSNGWMLYSGDGEQVADLSGYDINGTDKAAWFPKNGLFNTYEPVDFNLDGDISGADRLLWSYNNGIFSTVVR